MSRGSLLRAAERAKCDLAGDPHSASRVAKAAMQRATWGRTGRIADATGLSQRTVETWGNPADPQRSPVQVLEIVMRAAIESGAAHEEATAPLAYLNEIFLQSAPGNSSPTTVQLAAVSALRESSEGIALAVEAARDGEISKGELAAIERECSDAITALHSLVREARSAHQRPLRGKAFTQPAKGTTR